MLALRLDPDTDARLAAMAAKTGRTKSFYAREAIETHLRDLEDYYLAEERLRGHVPGSGTSLDSLIKEFGVSDIALDS